MLSGQQWTPLGSRVECSLAGSLRRATHLPWFLGVVRGCSAAVGSGSGRATCRCRLWPPGRQGDGRGRETLSVATDTVNTLLRLLGGQDSLPSLRVWTGVTDRGPERSYLPFVRSTSSFPSASSLQTNRRYCTQSAPCRCVCVWCVWFLHPQIPAYSWVFERPVLAPSEDCQAVRCGNAGKLGGRDREKEVDGHRKEGVQRGDRCPPI